LNIVQDTMIVAGLTVKMLDFFFSFHHRDRICSTRPSSRTLTIAITGTRMMELTPTGIAHNVHAHPTLSEVLMEAAHAVERSVIHI